MSGYSKLCEEFKIYVLNRFNNNWKESSHYCEYLISEVLEVDDLESRGIICFTLCYLNRYMCDYEKTKKYAEEAEELLSKLFYDELLIDVYGIMATFNNKKGYYKLTFQYAYKALKIAQKLYDETNLDKYRDELVVINIFMAGVCFKLGVNNIGEFYFNESMALKGDSHIERCDMYSNLYNYMYRKNEFKDAKIYAEKCFELSKKVRGAIPNEHLIDCICPIIKCDIALNNLEDAFKNLDYIKDISKVSNGKIYYLYGDLYSKLDNKALANENYIKAFKLYAKDGIYSKVLSILKKIISYYKDINDTNNELEYRRLFMQFSEKLNTVEEDYMMIDCVSKFHTERALLEKERIINEQQLAYSKDIENLAYKLITTVDELNVVQNQVNEKNKTIKVIAERLSRDTMTGIYNKEYILKKINEIDKNNNEFFIAMLDLDNYKRINDKYGHIFGDKVLKEVAWSIQNELRDGEFLGRFGGEEFIIVYKEKRLDYVLRSGERIRNNIENLKWQNGAKVTISIGVAKNNINRKNSYLQTIKKADKNLYEAKHRGKNMVCI